MRKRIKFLAHVKKMHVLLFYTCDNVCACDFYRCKTLITWRSLYIWNPFCTWQNPDQALRMPSSRLGGIGMSRTLLLRLFVIHQRPTKWVLQGNYPSHISFIEKSFFLNHHVSKCWNLFFMLCWKSKWKIFEFKFKTLKSKVSRFQSQFVHSKFVCWFLFTLY